MRVGVIDALIAAVKNIYYFIKTRRKLPSELG
jgi:hypothetical protein